ncbi:hypothetical protein D3C71_1356280 [compost metagenome]
MIGNSAQQQHLTFQAKCRNQSFYALGLRQMCFTHEKQRKPFTKLLREVCVGTDNLIMMFVNIKSRHI